MTNKLLAAVFLVLSACSGEDCRGAHGQDAGHANAEDAGSDDSDAGK